MQYMSFAPAGSVHSKASAIFYAQFCLLQIYQMLSEMQVPGRQKTHTSRCPFTHTYSQVLPQNYIGLVPNRRTHVRKKHSLRHNLQIHGRFAITHHKYCSRHIHQSSCRYATLSPRPHSHVSPTMPPWPEPCAFRPRM